MVCRQLWLAQGRRVPSGRFGQPTRASRQQPLAQPGSERDFRYGPDDDDVRTHYHCPNYDTQNVVVPFILQSPGLTIFYLNAVSR